MLSHGLLVITEAVCERQEKTCLSRSGLKIKTFSLSETSRGLTTWHSCVFSPSPSNPASPLYQLPRRSSNRKCTQALIIITLLTPAGGIKNSYLLKTPLLRNKHHRRLGVRHSPCNEIGNVMKSLWTLNHTLSFLVMSPPPLPPLLPPQRSPQLKGSSCPRATAGV